MLLATRAPATGATIQATTKRLLSLPQAMRIMELLQRTITILCRTSKSRRCRVERHRRVIAAAIIVVVTTMATHWATQKIRTLLYLGSRQVSTAQAIKWLTNRQRRLLLRLHRHRRLIILRRPLPTTLQPLRALPRPHPFRLRAFRPCLC